eukprot:12004395-Alexandrium_andersonii.AAC.1
MCIRDSTLMRGLGRGVCQQRGALRALHSRQCHRCARIAPARTAEANDRIAAPAFAERARAAVEEPIE